MTADELSRELASLGMQLQLRQVDGRAVLGVVGAAGRLTAELRRELAEHGPELVRALRAATAAPTGGLAASAQAPMRLARTAPSRRSYDVESPPRACLMCETLGPREGRLPYEWDVHNFDGCWYFSCSAECRERAREQYTSPDAQRSLSERKLRIIRTRDHGRAAE